MIHRPQSDYRIFLKNAATFHKARAETEQNIAEGKERDQGNSRQAGKRPRLLQNVSRSGRDATQRCALLQCFAEYDFSIDGLTTTFGGTSLCTGFSESFGVE